MIFIYDLADVFPTKEAEATHASRKTPVSLYPLVALSRSLSFEAALLRALYRNKHPCIFLPSYRCYYYLGLFIVHVSMAVVSAVVALWGMCCALRRYKAAV